MKNPGEVIVLVGAGASVSLNIPAMGGMFQAFLQKSRSGLSQDERRICHLFVNELGVQEDLEEFLLAANTIVDSQDQGLWRLTEKIISPSMRGTRVKKHREKLQRYVADIKDVTKHILDFMSRTCFQFERQKARDMLSGFVDAVAHKGYPVYTTNYDFSLEYAAEERGIAIHDNFVPKGRRYMWNPQISYPLGNALTIVKLHGSVTWYLADNDVIEKIDSYATLNAAGHKVERLVIFPARFKDIYDQNFFALYSHLLGALSTAKCIVVVGHSLRDEYIRAAIIERFRKGDLHIVVVDPFWPQALPGELRPAKVGTAGKLTHIPRKFEDFSDDLAHVLRTKTSATIARACAAIFHQMKFKKSNLRLKGRIGVLKPGVTKEFSASIDAYILRHHRPVCVRAWLEADFKAPSGEQKHEVTRTFINVGDPDVRLGLSGTLKTDVPIKVRIPKYPDWLEHAQKVRLRVALLDKSQRAPMGLKSDTIIAEDSRELTYTN